MLQLLEMVQKLLQKQTSVNGLPDVDPSSDYLMLSNRMELLLPRNEQLRNFVEIQKGKYEPIKLWLVRDLKELIPKARILLFSIFSKNIDF